MSSPISLRSTFREIVRLGWPVFVAQMAVMGNGFIDTVMAGHYSTRDLAAVGVGASIYMSIFVGIMGVLLALTPIVSQLYGAGRFRDIGEEVRQSMWLSVALAMLCFAALRFPGPFLALTRLEPEVEAVTREYLAASSWGVPAMLLFRIFYGFSTAVSKPRTIMLLNLTGLALKVPLNWVFMYGKLGLPEMGGVGCAWSSTVIACVIATCAWYWCFADRDYHRYDVFGRWSWPDARRIGHIVSLGLPIGATFFVDVTGFTFMALFIARLGSVNTAAHQIAGNFAAILYMLPLAVGNAASVLVGQAIGAKDYARARATGIAGIATAFAIACTIAGIVVLSRHVIASTYSTDERVLTLASTLLAFVAGYHLFDSIQAVAVNVLRGYKRAMVPMVIYAFALWGVGLGGGYVLGLTDVVDLSRLGLETPLGAKGFWMAAIASLLLAGSGVTGYFLRVSAVRP
jgi:multidrug resistance protein, MATE family